MQNHVELACSGSQCNKPAVGYLISIANRRLENEIYFCDTHETLASPWHVAPFSSRLGSAKVVLDATECDLHFVACRRFPSRGYIRLHELEGNRSFGVNCPNLQASIITSFIEYPEAPTTHIHDTLNDVASELGYAIEYILVTQVESEPRCSAIIEMQSSTSSMQVKSPPGDAIALAIRTSTPLFVSNWLLQSRERKKTINS
jgi:bifunctional DNase/RNase